MFQFSHKDRGVFEEIDILTFRSLMRSNPK